MASERYTIVRELGRGAMSTVYAARDSSTGAVVALKTLDPALFQEPSAELAELFLRNARSATTLRHRNIVRTFDAGKAGGTAYVAMELVEGESLRKMMDERPLPIARAIQIFDDIASALAYAHEERVVHRGVRPSNILVSGCGAKLGDFGLGQIGAAALRYASPEQVRRDALDHRSDLYSLGVVFYEMLTRQAPLEGQPPLPSKVNPHVPAALDALVSRLLAPRPDDRFANARDLLRELQRLEDAIGLRPGGTVAAAAPQPKPPAAEDVQHEIRIPVDESFHAPEATFMEERGLRPEPSLGSRITSSLAALALVLAGLSIGLTVALHYSPDLIERLTVAIRTKEAPTPAAVAAPVPPAIPPVTEAVKEPAKPEEPPIVATAPKAVPPVPLVREPDESKPRETVEASAEEAAPVQKAPRAAKRTAKAPEPQPAKLIVAVSPRGELYIDDEHRGTTPPLRTLDLEPGMHRIEIRNGSRKPYVTYVTVQAGDERRIRHDFGAKPVRLPR